MIDTLKSMIPSISSAVYMSGHLARLNNSTKNETPREMSRYSGGSTRENQPYITGYHQVLFFLPMLVFTMNTFSSQKWLRCTCESFVPHSSTMNMADVPGFGGVNLSFPIGRVTNREFTLGFREYQNLPILNIFKTWHSIYEPHTGTGVLTSLIKQEFFSPNDYKGTIIVANVKPSNSEGKITGKDLEDVNIYQGCFPINIPLDMVNTSDQVTNESVVCNIQFRFDGAPIDLNTLGIETLVAGLLNESYYDTYDEFEKIL